MKRVLIVDDHAILRQGLLRTLRELTEGTLDFQEASSGAEAIGMVHDSACDLVVLDISLPDQNGLEVLRQLKLVHPELPVIMLSSHSDELYAVRSFRAGASGYINKGSDSDLLKEAIERVLTGKNYVSPAQADLLVESIGRKSECQPTPEILSDREYQLVYLIAAGKTLIQIAGLLSVSPKTVSTYRARVLEKLNLKTTADIVKYGVQHNLVGKE